MENQLQAMGRRIQEARTILDISVEEMAKLHGISEAEYLKHENGEVDSSFTFLLRCADRFGMDIGALFLGESPRLSFYTLTRKDGGFPIKRRAGFEYLHQAAHFKKRQAEPFVVVVPFIGENAPIHLSTHSGQEFDFVLSGKLKVQLEDNVEYLEAGDSIYYDSSHRHGMIASGGEQCKFLAVVIKGQGEEPVTVPAKETEKVEPVKDTGLIYHKFMNETLDEQGHLKAVSFNVPKNFNFAFDVLDALAAKCPDKTAMRWISCTHEVRNFSFKDISEASARTANYLKSLGIGRGDRVMLVLRRHYQFWFSLNALHRLGAIAVPATNQLVKKDFEYRFNKGEIKAIICSNDDGLPDFVDEAQQTSPSLKCKILVNGTRDGWHDFNRGIENFPSKIERNPDQRATDPMLMFFSSGTTGYPKIVSHNFMYPLGHIVTARWWHNVVPGGLHFTIADTGWGKALWGKIYGQWFCEAAIFTYDFVRFHAEDILPMFKEHNITTFCAPPTMYRFFIKEDLSKYDFSSLKYATTAGEALNAEVFQKFKEATGLSIMESFGQTESTMLIGNLRGTKPKPGSMGKPSPQFHIDLFDRDDKPVGPGEVGEIVVKAEPNEVCGLFQGYFRDEERTSEVWRDGWYHTGDTAWRDEDNYYTYVGRVDDLIKSSGYRIGPFEIESVLMELPYVLECAVTGVPDPVRGQVVKATIVLTKNTVGTDELKKDIQDYVKSHTAPYKYPRIVEFVPELPKTISGKIRRVALRNQDAKKQQ